MNGTRGGQGGEGQERSRGDEGKGMEAKARSKARRKAEEMIMKERGPEGRGAEAGSGIAGMFGGSSVQGRRRAGSRQEAGRSRGFYPLLRGGGCQPGQGTTGGARFTCNRGQHSSSKEAGQGKGGKGQQQRGDAVRQGQTSAHPRIRASTTWHAGAKASPLHPQCIQRSTKRNQKRTVSCENAGSNVVEKSSLQQGPSAPPPRAEHHCHGTIAHHTHRTAPTQAAPARQLPHTHPPGPA